MSNIYDQHDKAFRDMSAYVVVNDAGDCVATVAFKFARSGLRTTCYFHVLGFPMVKSFASGAGYDKKSASAFAAVKKIVYHGGTNEDAQKVFDQTKILVDAIEDKGREWTGDLRAAGFRVYQTV